VPFEAKNNQETISYRILERPVNNASNLAVEQNSDSEYIIAFAFEIMVVVLLYNHKKNI
jgi:hypothetical protein